MINDFNFRATVDAALLREPGLLTQGSRGSHMTPWHPVEDPLDPLQIGKVQKDR